MTQAERAHAALHQACHESSGELEYHNIETITIDDETAYLLYLSCASDLHLYMGGTYQDMPYRTCVAAVCLPRELQLRYCLIDGADRFFRIAVEPNHQLPYKGTTIGDVFDLWSKMGMTISPSTVRKWKGEPLV